MRDDRARGRALEAAARAAPPCDLGALTPAQTAALAVFLEGTDWEALRRRVHALTPRLPEETPLTLDLDLDEDALARVAQRRVARGRRVAQMAERWRTAGAAEDEREQRRNPHRGPRRVEDRSRGRN